MSIQVLYLNGTAGLDYVQSPTLAFVSIFRVALEGVQYTETTGAPGNLQFQYESSTGRIYFAAAFTGAVKVMVKYQASTDIITTCDPVVGTITLPNGTVGLPYSYSAPFTGTLPFVLNVTAKPTWMTIALVAANLEFTGTPDVAADTTVTLTLSNCDGGTVLAVSGSVHIDPMPVSPTNFTFSNVSFLSKILGVYGFAYVASTGSPTLLPGETCTGVFTDFTAAINVVVETVPGGSLLLKKNGTTIQTISIPAFGDGTKIFSSVSFVAADTLEIILTS